MNDDINRPKDLLREKVSETRQNLADMAHLAKETVQDKFHELRDRAAQKYGAGKDRMHEYEESFTRKVSEAPMKSVLIAAGVGLLLGFLWRRG